MIFVSIFTSDLDQITADLTTNDRPQPFVHASGDDLQFTLHIDNVGKAQELAGAILAACRLPPAGAGRGGVMTTQSESGTYAEQRRPGEIESVVDQKLYDAVNALDDAILAIKDANEHALWLPEELEKFVSSDLLTLLDGLRRQERALDQVFARWKRSLMPPEDPR